MADWSAIGKLALAGAQAAGHLAGGPEDAPRTGFGDQAMRDLFARIRNELLKELGAAQERQGGKRIRRKGPSTLNQPRVEATLPSGRNVTFGGESGSVGFDVTGGSSGGGSNPFAGLLAGLPQPGATRPTAGPGGTGGGASASVATGDVARRMGVVPPTPGVPRTGAGVADSDLTRTGRPDQTATEINRRVDARMAGPAPAAFDPAAFGARPGNALDTAKRLLENLRQYGVY